MSAKRGRRTKLQREPPQLNQMDFPNVSAIDKVSFMEGLQLNYGNPLHSTAMEEDFYALEERQRDGGIVGRGTIPDSLKTTVAQHGAAVKRKGTQQDGEKRKSSRTSTTVRIKTRNPVKSQDLKNQERETESGSRKIIDVVLQEESDPALLSDEENDEDTSWNPSQTNAKVVGLGRTRKSSSDGMKSKNSLIGSASGETTKAKADKQRGNRRYREESTDLEVALDGFLDFCYQYKNSLDSTAVKRSIEHFSNNVKGQLLEANTHINMGRMDNPSQDSVSNYLAEISNYKEVRVLKRDNTKLGSLIRRETQRLLDAKCELRRAERQEWLLQKEKVELQHRLTNLRQGQAFLCDVIELNRLYLDYQHKHPTEKEMYGASSLPALLLESKLKSRV